MTPPVQGPRFAAVTPDGGGGGAPAERALAPGDDGRDASRSGQPVASAHARAVSSACDAIAPSWPLDRSIAVNPFWELRELPFDEVAVRLAERSGATLLPGAEHLRPLVEAGRLTDAHLARAAAELDLPAPRVGELDQLDRPAPAPLPLLTHWLDARRDLTQSMSWDEEVIHQISQFCAALFDRGQSRWRPADDTSLYSAWHAHTRRDRGLAVLMDAPQVAHALAQLPDTAEALLDEAVAALDLDDASLERLLQALLLNVNGWASLCAYRRWQARQAGGDDDSLRELLAVRLAWDLALMRGATDAAGVRSWRAALADGAARERRHRVHQRQARIWLRAAELSWQDGLLAGLAGSAGSARPTTRPRLQAAFCIDVRSEVFRRALEAGGAYIQTLGCAGFFGLPIAHQERDGRALRPQLPGLLAPTLLVREQGDPQGSGARRDQAQAGQSWQRGRSAAAASFTAVESFGLGDAFALLRDGLLGRPAQEHSSDTRPALVSDLQGRPVSLAQRIDLAAALVQSLSLGPDPAPLVLLMGHGSSTTNNPGAAALDCGACCGRPGVANARIAAALLNDVAVRAGLEARGLVLPEDTWFVPGLHDTTTDDCTLHDTDELPDGHRPQLTAARELLAEAGHRARAERAPALGLAATDPGRLARQVRRRARDWAEVRPEWGLTGNASFVIAPRERTRGLDLGGRAFLHDYRWREDVDFGRLAGLLTAPMLVTHWINLQYYASTVDPLRYGSGNKVLHNVVGGSLGVFEGNGGDLRLGLARQSLHDGQRWRHEPLRLTVCVQAPREALARLVAEHEVVRQLVDGEWLSLIQLDDDGPGAARLLRGRWEELSPAGRA